MIGLITAMALISCNGNTPAAVQADDGNVEVGLSIEMAKSLTVEVPDEVAKYQYRAIPLFTVADESTENAADTQPIFGEQLQWTDISIVEDLASLGYFRQGHWRFEVRSLNRSGHIIATGSTRENTPEPDIYLQKGKVNLVRITLHADNGENVSGQDLNTGKVRIGFETNYLAELDNAFVEFEVQKVKHDGTLYPEAQTWPLKNDKWTVVKAGAVDNDFLGKIYGKTVGASRIRYYAETPDLTEAQMDYTDPETGEITSQTYWAGGIKAGNYLLKIYLCVKDSVSHETVRIAGQLIGVKVVGGETSVVSGTFVPEVYIETGLTITIPPSVDGKITEDAGTELFLIKSDNLNTTSLSLKYTTAKPVSAGTKYLWYLNGNLISGEEASTLIFRPTQYGDNKITCVVRGGISSGNNDQGELSSATSVIRVVPATGPNVPAV